LPDVFHWLLRCGAICKTFSNSNSKTPNFTIIDSGFIGHLAHRSDGMGDPEGGVATIVPRTDSRCLSQNGYGGGGARADVGQRNVELAEPQPDGGLAVLGADVGGLELRHAPRGNSAGPATCRRERE
jgi:hypothetical protein